ncbi:MAG: copper homeostasis protein CutC [Bacteroidales bacterium]|nr:copper homeostasis protein CutC [Bacteroidales bacterium]
MIRFELCANGYESLLNGVDGGADCAELCEALEVGGLTPSLGTLKRCAQIMQSTDVIHNISPRRIPVRVLVRCRPGNYIYNDVEVAIMCEDIKTIKDLGYEGVVIGALNAEGDLDVPAIKKMMASGDGMKFTFHRAIDACNNPLDAMETLINLGFDKVLTSGCKPTAYEGIDMIREFQTLFGDRINIMAGGGINESNVERIITATGICNVHASLTSEVADNHSDLYPNGIDNTGASMTYKVSNLIRITEFVDVINI